LYSNGWNRPATEWWSDALKIVKNSFPSIIFLGEVYSPWEPNLQAVGFDYTYDKNLYDKLTNGNLDDIRNWISSNTLEFTTHSAHCN
jgi:hypothetical protein